MGRRFETSLAPPKTKWAGGYKAGAIDPSKIADDVMGQVEDEQEWGARHPEWSWRCYRHHMRRLRRSVARLTRRAR